MSPVYPLLGLILRGSAYGYELKRIVETEFAPYWQIDFAQLYRSLARLQAQRLVRVSVKPGVDGPERKLYTATRRGRDAYREWVRQPAASHVEAWVKRKLVDSLEFRDEPALFIAGSDDPLLAQLASGASASWSVLGSTAGLLALAEGQAEIAGAHLREPSGAEYNISYVQHLVPDQDVLVVQLARREYGLMVAPGNPHAIHTVRDIVRRKARLINRGPGAGARLWLQHHWRAARLNLEQLYAAPVATRYDGIARAIATGAADVGPGVRAAAEQSALDFISLGEERFDLIVPRALYESARGARLFARLHDQANKSARLPGYDLAQTGRIQAEIKYGQVHK